MPLFIDFANMHIIQEYRQKYVKCSMIQDTRGIIEEEEEFY